MPDKLDLEFQIKIAEASLAKAKAQIASLQSNNKTLGKMQVGVDASGIRATRSALGQIRNDADQFTKSMAAANARVLAFGTAVGVIEGMRRSFIALIKTTVGVEEALTKISVVAGDDLTKAGVSISQLGKSFFGIARDTGQSFETVNQAALEFQRQGIGVQESLKRTRDAMIAVRISGVSVGDAVSGLTSILNAFKKSGLDSTTVLNKLVALDNSSAASFPDLIQGMQRAASVSQLAGNNFDQTAASIATLQEITARGGPVIGNALKSIDTRLYGEKSLEFLEKFQGGIVKTKDSAGQLLPSIEIIRSLSQALKTVPKGEQLGVLTKLSGLYQVNSLSALVDSFQLVEGEISLYDKNLRTSLRTTNEAGVANKKLSEILASQFNTINVNIGEFLNKLGEIGVKNPLSGVLDFLIKIQGTLQGILEGSGPLDTIIQKGAKFAGGALFSTPVVAGGAFVLVKIIKDFLSFSTTAFKVFTGINQKLNEEGSLSSTINSKLKATNGELNSAFGTEQRRLSLIKSANAEYSKQLALTTSIASATIRPSTSFLSKGVIEGVSNVRKSGGIVGDVGGYLPSIIGGNKPNLASVLGSSINNDKATVSGASATPSGLALGKPNISSGLRNKSGQFIDSKGVSNALGLLINSWVFAGKESLEMGNLIRKAVGDFDLGPAFKIVSKEANAFAQQLIKERNASNIRAKAAIPSSLGKLNTSGTGLTSNAQFAGLGFNRPATEISKVGLGGFPNISNLPQFNSERLALKSATEQRLRIDTNNRIAEQQKLAQKTRARDFIRDTFNRVETRRGEAQKRLNELKSGQSDTVNYGFQGVIARKDAIQRQRREVAFQAALAKQVKAKLQAQDKELYEEYGVSAGSSSKTVISESQKANQLALKERLQNKFGNRASSGEPLLNGGNTLAGLRRSDDISGAKKTGFDSDALRNFAFKTVLVTSLFSGLSESLRGVSPGLDKFADFLSTASLAGGGIATLNNVGGVSLGSLAEKASKFDPKSLTGFQGKLSTAFSPLLAFGAGFAKFLPIIGQAGLIFSVFNSAIKQLTGSSIIDRLSLALGGLTEEAEKARDGFNEMAKGLFDNEGKYTGRSLSDRQTSLSGARRESLQKINAERQGIKTEGKTPQEIGAESIRKLISDAVGDIEVGGLIDSGGEGSNSVRKRLVSDLSKSSQELLFSTLGDITTGTLDELRGVADGQGIKKIGNIDIKDSSREQIATALAKAFVDQFIAAYGNKKDVLNNDLENAIEEESGRIRLAAFAQNFNRKGETKKSPTNNLIGGSAKEITPESRKKFFDFQKDLLESIYNSASSQVEAEIKNLDAQFNNPSLTQSARRQLEKQKDILTQEALNIGNLSANAEFKNNKQLIQSQLGVNDKTQEDIDRELFILERNLKNTNEQYKNSTILLNGEISAREKANESLDKFTKSFNKIDSTILLLGTRGAKNAQSISKLNFQATSPLNTTLQQEAASRAINNSSIDDLKDKKRVAGLGLDKALLDPNISLEDAREAREGYKQLSIEIDTKIAELENATKGIGAIANTSIELANSLTDFERSIPSSRAQNDFNTLQSTDASGIAGGLISKQVFGEAEGKSGEELVSFLADQNFLLNEQFKIRTASNAAEKLELETQLELSRELLDIKTQSLDPSEKQRQIEEAINKNLEKRRSFGFGVAQAQSNIQSEIQTFGSDFGKTATEGFRDGLVSAMQVAVSQTDNLKESLLDVALAFANKLRDAALTNLANVITNSFVGGSGGSSGGIVSSLVGAVGGYFTGGAKKYAAGGTVTGGSGVKDDVPTLLMGGEYVIPKSTVQEYGKGFFDSLRNGSVGKMAQGGYFAPGVRGQGTISGKENLLNFATQTATSGSGDYISQLSGNAAIASLEPESLRLSNFNRFGDSPIVQATQDTKEQAFGLYLDQLNSEKEYQAQLREQELQAREQEAAIAKAKKDKKKQFLISLALAAVGAGVSYGAGGAKAGAAAGKTSASSASSISNQRYYDVATGILKTSASAASSSYGGGYGVPYANAPAFSGANKQVSYSNLGSDVAGIYSGFSNNRMVNRSPYAPVGGYGFENPLLPKIYANGQYRNSGGYVGGNGDNVPAMLSNKEYVLNSSAAQKLGDKNLYALNNGQPQSGGDSSDKIISKLDELIEKTIGASNVTVTVSMDSSGNEKSSQSNGDDQQKNNNQRNLSQKIKETVVNVIREEQRPGGILARR